MENRNKRITAASCDYMQPAAVGSVFTRRANAARYDNPGAGAMPKKYASTIMPSTIR